MSCFLLFRVAEIHRIDETTATPGTEGASLSEQQSFRRGSGVSRDSNDKGISTTTLNPPLCGFFLSEIVISLQEAEYRIEIRASKED